MGADCKSVAKATVVRTHYLPPESARFRRGLALSLLPGLSKVVRDLVFLIEPILLHGTDIFEVLQFSSMDSNAPLGVLKDLGFRSHVHR